MNKKFKKYFIILLILFGIISIFGNVILFNKYTIQKKRAINMATSNLDKFIHFSIDDCIDVFSDLDKNKEAYDSIFENKLLKYLKNLNNEYGCVFSLFVFKNNEEFDIVNCTDKYKKEFEENANWLKFGFHALNSESDYERDESANIIEDYKNVLGNLKRIVGEKSITNTFRTEKFLLNEENAKLLKEIEDKYSLLGTDTPDRLNYYLNEKQNEQVFKNEYYFDEDMNILIYNTDFRLENISKNNIDKMLNSMNDKNLIIFTHEWLFNNMKSEISLKYKIDKICKYAIKNGYEFEYPYEN